MPLICYPNGAGESLGDALITEEPLYSTGSVWYVNSATGTDAASPAGRNRSKPLATLEQAHTNASAGDIIVLMDGHSETLTSALTLSKAVAIVGAGKSSGKPTVKFTINSSSSYLFNVTGDDVQLKNIWIEENSQANALTKIVVSGDGFRMIGCYVEANDNDDAACLSVHAGNGMRIESTIFISTSTTTTTQPKSAIEVTLESNDLELKDVTLDGGTVGWSDFYAFDATDNAINRLKATGVNLLNGSDMDLTGSTGWLALGTLSGGSRVDGLGDHYPNGLDPDGGNEMLTGKPFITSGDVWYVHATEGTDGSGSAGQNRSKPLATLAQAITNAAHEDIIVLKDGHTETVTSAWAVAKRLTIVGAGSSDGKPTAKLTLNAASASMFTPSSDNVDLRNIWIEENAQSNSTSKILVTGDFFRMVGCYVEGNANDTSALLTFSTSANHGRLEQTTFISTATVNTALPEAAISCPVAISDLELEGVTIDGGAVGWDNFYALINTGTLSRLRALGCSFLRGSDVQLENASTGWLTAPTATGSVRIECAPPGA